MEKMPGLTEEFHHIIIYQSFEDFETQPMFTKMIGGMKINSLQNIAEVCLSYVSSVFTK